MKVTVESSTISSSIGVRSGPETHVPPMLGEIVVLVSSSSHHQRIASVVKAVPSDHFMPSRRWNVHSEASSLISHDSAMRGCMFRFWSYQDNPLSCIFVGPQRSETPLKPRRNVPP